MFYTQFWAHAKRDSFGLGEMCKTEASEALVFWKRWLPSRKDQWPWWEILSLHLEINEVRARRISICMISLGWTFNVLIVNKRQYQS